MQRRDEHAASDIGSATGGKSVAIEPEGYHVMLIDLVNQVKAGDQVPLTPIVEDSKGVKEQIEVKAEARARETACRCTTIMVRCTDSQLNP